MKTLIFCFLLLLATASAEPLSHAKTGIDLPDTLAGAKRGNTVPYPKGDGIMVEFRTESLTATVYLRPLFERETAASIVESSLEPVKVIYSEVKILADGDQPAVPGWSKATFTARADGAPIKSYIYGSVKGDQAIKLRVTVRDPATADPKGETAQKLFVEFQKIVDAAKPK